MIDGSLSRENDERARKERKRAKERERENITYSLFSFIHVMSGIVDKVNCESVRRRKKGREGDEL